MRRRTFLRGLLGVAAIPYVGFPAPIPKIIPSIPYKLGNYTIWVRSNHREIIRNLMGKNEILDGLSIR